MTEQLLSKILDSNLSQETKDKIFEFWMLPEQPLYEFNNTTDTDKPAYIRHSGRAPIQKQNESRVGSIKRPSKEELDLRADPRKQDEIEAMEETLEEVI